MKKVLIYPFGEESKLIVDYYTELKELEPVCLVGLRGWDHNEKVYEVGEREFPLCYDFKTGYEKYKPDVVWFVDFHATLDFEKFYLPHIRFLMKEKVKIITSNALQKKMERYFAKEKVALEKKNYLEIEDMNDGVLKQLNTPVIYICSLYGGLNKFDIQMKIRQELKERDISIVQVGTREEAEYFGFYSIPEYMFDNTVSEKDKIMNFNNYLKKLEMIEKPQLMVIGVPGGLYSPSEKYVADFGLLAMKFFIATTPDIVIMSLPYDSYIVEDLEEISKMVKGRFGCEVDYYNLANKRFQLSDSELAQKHLYLSIDGNNKNWGDMKKMFNTKNQEHVKKLVDMLLNKLTGYGQIHSI